MKKTISIVLIVLTGASLAGISCVDGAVGTATGPGYRPGGPQADAFLAAGDARRVAVLPTVIRTRSETIYSPPSRDTIIAGLKEKGLGIGVPVDLEVTPGEAASAQFDLFKAGLAAIGPQVAAQEAEADYFLVLELLITPVKSGGSAVGGIQCYVLDKKGTDAFSFLLNSHHRAFTDANLRIEEKTQEEKDRIVAESTALALEALAAQTAAAGTPTSH